jgi:cholesterol transport system auxiliary component
MKRQGVTLTLVAVLCAACSLTPTPRAPIASYDLGQDESRESAPATRLAAVFVVHEPSGPLHLVGHDMLYRLLFDEPARLRRFANSQWALSPLQMIGERVRGRLAFAAEHGGAVPDYGIAADFWVRLTVEEFCQVFDAPGSSRGMVRLRVVLLRGRSRSFVAQETFGAQEPAPSADARGGAQALGRAADAAVGAAVSWIVAQSGAAGKAAGTP